MVHIYFGYPHAFSVVSYAKKTPTKQSWPMNRGTQKILGKDETEEKTKQSYKMFCSLPINNKKKIQHLHLKHIKPWIH
ncbi:hypothetical protein C2I06_12905 [Niallia circulans]|nr:hypothetical protein C2I06_12905 [Niallia circulans]